MDIFTSVGQSFSDKTEIVKLKKDISTNKQQIAKIMESIGKQYYELHSEDHNAEFINEIQEIKDIEQEIYETRLALCRLRGTVLCTSCLQESDSQYNFCPHCGAKLEKEEIESEPDCNDDMEDESYSPYGMVGFADDDMLSEIEADQEKPYWNAKAETIDDFVKK